MDNGSWGFFFFKGNLCVKTKNFRFDRCIHRTTYRCMEYSFTDLLIVQQICVLGRHLVYVTHCGLQDSQAKFKTDRLSNVLDWTPTTAPSLRIGFKRCCCMLQLMFGCLLRCGVWFGCNRIAAGWYYFNYISSMKPRSLSINGRR